MTNSNRKLKPFHWRKMGGGSDLKGTVWDEVGAYDLDSLVPNAHLLSQGLEDLFVATEAKPMRMKGTKGARRTGPVVLDMRRTHAVSIGIANIKLPAAGVVARLGRLDYRALSTEQLESLLSVLPTDEELKALRAHVDKHDGDVHELSLPEQYLLELGGTTKPLRAVHVCMTLHTYGGDAHLVRTAAELVRNACVEIMSSVRLTKLLGLILAMGNAMNSGTSYGGARGFFIDSLLRMASVKASSTDKRNLSLLHYTVSAVYSQDPGALELPEELPSLEKAAAVEFDVQITNALRDLRVALRRVQLSTPPLELPKFEERYPYLHDADAGSPRLAVRLTHAATVFVVVTEQHSPADEAASSPSKRQASVSSLLSPTEMASAGAPNAAPSDGASSSDSASPAPLGPPPAFDVAVLLGVSAEGVRDGSLPAGCGTIVHVGRQAVHAGFTYMLGIGGLQPGKRYAAFLASEDTFKTWPPDGPRAVALHPTPIHFSTLSREQASGADAQGDRAGAIAEEEEGEEEAAAAGGDGDAAGEEGTTGGAGADFSAQLNAMLVKRGSTGAARGPAVVVRRRPSGAARTQAADAGSQLGAAQAADASEPEQLPPEGPPEKRAGEDADALHARAQVLTFSGRAEPELAGLEELEADVRQKLLDLGRYFGEPKSNAIEVLSVLVTLKDFLNEFKKVKIAVIEQRRIQERITAQAERVNRRRTFG
ncbi:hypothetical protein T492DRAFT_1056219 [Pavlovales sp. CCMP2436]|nr:hypothetical protein T492DRAFT_1056219 [Pavlovales sp. CCMP2436]